MKRRRTADDFAAEMKVRTSDQAAHEIARLTEELWPLIAPKLRGHDPMVQGGALADLTARWLAGHIAGDADTTRRFRQMLLEDHIRVVWKLIDVNEQGGLD